MCVHLGDAPIVYAACALNLEPMCTTTYSVQWLFKKTYENWNVELSFHNHSFNCSNSSVKINPKYVCKLPLLYSNLRKSLLFWKIKVSSLDINTIWFKISKFCPYIFGFSSSIVLETLTLLLLKECWNLNHQIEPNPFPCHYVFRYLRLKAMFFSFLVHLFLAPLMKLPKSYLCW